MEKERLHQLLMRSKEGHLPVADFEELRQFFVDPANKDLFVAVGEELLSGPISEQPFDESWLPILYNALSVDRDMFAQVPTADLKSVTNTFSSAPYSRSVTHRIHFLKTSWFRYAAILLLIVGVATFLYRTNRPQKEIVRSTTTPDIAPGGNNAILILSDGSRIELESAANGALAQQGSTRIMKLDAGAVAYRGGVPTGNIGYNTIATPKSGQYQITLPDGSRVWLNASSSITFPTAFTGNKRKVKIEGEVYFEVAKNKQTPFIVDVDGKSQVEVLGTSFNINSYTDEGSIKTTLLEGSVRVSDINATAITGQPNLSERDDKLKGSVILKPGQQAVVASADRQLKVINDIDVDQALAWKNGIFNFNGADLHTVMRQLERWYDIKVQYKGSVSNIIFKGKMYRNVNLSDVLDMLKRMGVQFELKGKSLIIF